MRFENPQNGYIEECNSPGVWAFFFGFFYFAVKGIWTHAVAGLILGICTLGLSWLIYPFFARGIVRAHFLRKGWTHIDPGPEDIDEEEEARSRIIRRGMEREAAMKSKAQKNAEFDATLARAGKRLAQKQRPTMTNEDD